MQGLLCDVCKLGREARTYNITIYAPEEGSTGIREIAYEAQADLCPKDFERLKNRIQVAITPPEKREKKTDNTTTLGPKL